MKVVLVTGGFDPLHSGHLDYFREAKKLGDVLVVGLNSDEWLTRKKGRPFMPFKERLAIIEALEMVDDVISFEDKDDTANHAIFKLMCTSASRADIIFANGGDRKKGAVPEEKVYHDKVEFVYGVGGDNKKNSSSWILEEWKNPKTVRNWGWYRVLDDKIKYKVKELVITPGQSLSDQKHYFRSEHWYVLKGKCVLDTEYNSNKDTVTLSECTNGYSIGCEVWHKASNPFDEHCHILEVQYGEKCVEEDIERRD
mgnify:FL=1|tara:strand:- start:694 stop:1455 length:762 start_codon:yes stop_codon:yes gene_type:complete